MSVFSTLEKFAVGSEGDLTVAHLDLTRLKDGKGACGVIFRTLGRLNHSYESSESLASRASSSACLSSAESEKNLLSVFSVVEQLTLNYSTSRGNLFTGEASLVSPVSPSSPTAIGTFFKALQEYLSVYNTNDSGEEDVCAVAGETIFPKLC